MGVILSRVATVVRTGLRIMRASRLVMSVASGTLIDGSRLVAEGKAGEGMTVMWMVREEEGVGAHSGRARHGMSKDRFAITLPRPRSRSGSTLSGSLH